MVFLLSFEFWKLFVFYLFFWMEFIYVCFLVGKCIVYVFCGLDSVVVLDFIIGFDVELWW